MSKMDAKIEWVVLNRLNWFLIWMNIV